MTYELFVRYRLQCGEKVPRKEFKKTLEMKLNLSLVVYRIDPPLTFVDTFLYLIKL